MGSNYSELAGERALNVILSRALDLRHVGVWTSEATSILSLALSWALSVSAVRQMGAFRGGMTGRSREPGGGCSEEKRGKECLREENRSLWYSHFLFCKVKRERGK